jgi:hypothetical protein
MRTTTTAVAVAAADQLPDRALEPDEAFAIQSEGRVMVTRFEPESAVAQLAGAEPVKMYSFAEVPTVVSN